MSKPIAILYEHPEWFKPLFAALDRRGADYVHLDATKLTWDPAERESPYSLVVNRMSPSAWKRGNTHAIFSTLAYLEHLDRIGANVLNGARAFRHELSKADQADVFEELGIRYPRTRIVNHASQAPAAADGMTFPVVVKPNIGGSGAGIIEYATAEELQAAADAGAFDLGVDSTLLVQERLTPRDGHIVRIEIVGGELLYAIALDTEDGNFNLCPADYCRIDDGMADGVSGRGLEIRKVDPPTEIVDQVKAVLAACDAEVGGVEYLVASRDGEPYLYDVNALSNFVADADTILGFDPYEDLADLIVARADA